MNKNFLIAMVILLFFTGMGMVLLTLFSSVSILPKISNATKKMSDFDSMSNHSFYFDKIYFHESLETLNITDICTSLISKQIVIVDVIFKTTDTPDKCDIFIDNKFSKEISPYVPICKNKCPEEIELSVDINKQNIFRNHEIKLCCGGICIKKELVAKCND